MSLYGLISNIPSSCPDATSRHGGQPSLQLVPLPSGARGKEATQDTVKLLNGGQAIWECRTTI